MQPNMFVPPGEAEGMASDIPPTEPAVFNLQVAEAVKWLAK